MGFLSWEFIAKCVVVVAYVGAIVLLCADIGLFTTTAMDTMTLFCGPISFRQHSTRGSVKTQTLTTTTEAKHLMVLPATCRLFNPMQQLPLPINPLTGLPLLKPSPRCRACVEFYQFRVAGVGIEERCVVCNYSRGWVEKFKVKSRKKKPSGRAGQG